MNLQVSLKTMKTRILTVLTLVLSFSTGAFGQTETTPCATDELHERLLESDPIYQRSFFNLEQRIQELNATAQERDDEIYTIPVVIHVLHENEPIGQGSNISEEQVMSAITALNEDFRKLAGTNGDGDGVDTGFEFCLASRDPEGNATTGIVRVDGTVVPDYAEEGIQATGDSGADELTVKQLSIWPREDYLNIWVVNEIENNNAQSGIQGFAYFPIENPVDGIVILHNAIGTTGNIKPNTALNRTVAHEVGHYLGLYHTFHTTNDCSAELNCNTQGDRVCDTPPTVLSASCSNPACSGTQQVENYMDYTSESCRDMFSQGQKDRMRSTFLGDRFSLFSSMGCISVSDYDAGITDISSPLGSSCSSSFNPEVQLTNYGSIPLTAVNINYSVDNTNASEYSWTGNLASGASISVELPMVSASGEEHEFSAWTSLPNGASDENSSNNDHTSQFVISSGAGLELEITVDYFGSETSWEVKDNDTVLASGGPYVNANAGGTYNESICVPTGCYQLFFYDVYGDGMTFTSGSYVLSDSEGNVLVEGDGEFMHEISHDFCVEEVEQGPPPTANFSASNNLGCSGVNVDFQDSSTDAPVFWNWSFPGGSPSSSSIQNPQNITYSTPGTYNVTLTVGNAAGSDEQIITDLVVVYSGAYLTLNTTDVSCFGDSDGSVVAAISGQGPYTYSWNTGNSGNSISARPIGSYSLTVTDGNGCVSQSSATITQPEELTISISSDQPSCQGMSDGSLNALVSGGTQPFIVSWDSGDQGSEVFGLGSGNYNVLVEDENGCVANEGFILQDPSTIEVNLEDFDISCDGIFGSAEVNPTGGTGVLLIDWSSGEVGNSISDLIVGDYNVTVTDNNGCSSEENFTITESSSLNLALTITEISCNDLTDGGAQVNVTGGSGNYSYTWNTGNSWTSISGQGPGNYTVFVTDDQGCTGESNFSLSNPQALSISVFKSDISCYGIEDGTATATATGGSGNYNYDWDNGESGLMIEHLPVGIYAVTCADDHGCTTDENIQIIEPSLLTATGLIVTAETCAGNDGSGLVNAMGGTGYHLYEWSNGAETSVIQGLTAGEYTVEVTDDNGCSYTTLVNIPFDCTNAPDPTQLDETSCNAADLTLDDSITCTPVEGATMYNWKFTNPTTGLFAEEFTLGSNTTFLLSNVQNLGYGMNANVVVRVLGAEDIWSDWGTTCNIQMQSSIPFTSVAEATCETGIFNSSEVLHAESISGATTYEWVFSYSAEELVLTSYINQLTVPENNFFQTGVLYSVQVRSEVNNLWSALGDHCELTYDVDSSIQLSENESISLIIFPNPSAGENISIEFGNLPEAAHVIDIRVHDLSGKLVENSTLSIATLYPRLDYHFERKLTPGVYSLHIRLLNQEYKEKLIIR